MSFADLSAHPALQKALEVKGYAEPTPVQALVLSEEHRNRDLLVSSRTGSGKTIAFGLVLAKTLLPEDRFGPAGRPLALVVAPTRELAQQVQRELSWLYADTGARVISCVGGMDIRREQRALSDGAHIVVGTPGRLVDHLERKKLDLSGLRALVLDEADEMLDMGFRDELESLLQDAPEDRQTLLFSATLPPEIRRLAERYQKDSVRLAADAPKAAHSDIEYRAHLIAVREREHAVVNTLRSVDAPSAIVFCATRDAVARLHAALVERGFDAVALSGELSQAERNRALKALRDGRARVLVATDVAARGLDLPAVGLVIHADLPNDPSVLAHRSGRTGRAGRKGVSVVLSPSSRRRVAERMLVTNGVRVPWTEIPTPDEVRKKDLERFESEIEELAAEISEDDLEAARPIAEKLDAERLAAVLARRFRESLPAPEELPLSAGLADEAQQRESRTRRPKAHEDHSFQRRGGPFQSRDRSFDRRPPPPHGRDSDGSRPSRYGRGGGDKVWFRVNVGRNTNADPKWLLPMICRRGQLGREDIGAIRILPDESRFEIAAHAAPRFEVAVQKPDPKDRSLLIERSEAPFGGPRSFDKRPGFERGPRGFGGRAPDASSPDGAREQSSGPRGPWKRPDERRPFPARRFTEGGEPNRLYEKSERRFDKRDPSSGPKKYGAPSRYAEGKRIGDGGRPDSTRRPGFPERTSPRASTDRAGQSTPEIRTYRRDPQERQLDRSTGPDRPQRPASRAGFDKPRSEKKPEGRKFERRIPPSMRGKGGGPDGSSGGRPGDGGFSPPRRAPFGGGGGGGPQRPTSDDRPGRKSPPRDGK